MEKQKIHWQKKIKINEKKIVVATVRTKNPVIFIFKSFFPDLIKTCSDFHSGSFIFSFRHLLDFLFGFFVL